MKDSENLRFRKRRKIPLPPWRSARQELNLSINPSLHSSVNASLFPIVLSLSSGDGDELLEGALNEDEEDEAGQSALAGSHPAIVGETDPSAVLYRCPSCAFTSGSREYLISRHIKVREKIDIYVFIVCFNVSFIVLVHLDHERHSASLSIDDLGTPSEQI